MHVLNKILSTVLATVVLGGPVLAQYESVPDEVLFQSDEKRYGHLQYFGFYASAMGQWNFTEDLAPYTNLTWIHTGSAADPEAAIASMIERLQQASDAGVGATLSIESFLFRNEEGEPREQAEIEDFLVELRATIEFKGLLDTLTLIYPKDEPFREFVNARDPNVVEQYVTGEVYEDVHADLFEVNSIIKLVFPEKPIGVILSGHELHHDFFSIPENYDWVGFDCYKDLFESCDDRSFRGHYRQLLDHMQPHQRLMAIPETWALNEQHGNAGWPDILMSRLRHHYEIALNEPRFIAFIPFIWSFDSDNDVPGLGLNRFPELYDDGIDNPGSIFVEHVLDIGAQIKLGNHEYPNMAWSETENSPARPASNIRSDILDISAGGWVSAWAINDALPHKNLRMQIMLRDSKNALVHKSRPLRSFIQDPSLSQNGKIGYPAMGLHGYRYRLPADIPRRYRGRSLYLELISYADGAPMDIGFIASRVLSVARPLYSSSNPPPPGVDIHDPSADTGSGFYLD